MEFTYDAYTIMISELCRHEYQFADYRDHANMINALF